MNWLGRLLTKYLYTTDEVLDLGCGNMREFGVKPNVALYVGVDGFAAYLEALPQGVEAIEGMLPGVCDTFEDNTFDVVLLIDVLEHLTREDGEETLIEAERIARREILLFTPVGMQEQEAMDAWGLGYNPLQEHISGWEGEEIEDRGFEIIKVVGSKAGPMMLCRREL